MSAGGGDLRAGAIGRVHYLAAHAINFGTQFVDVFANLSAHLDDGLVQLGLDLVADFRRACGNQLADMRAKFSRRRIDNLKFFLDADREAMSHGEDPPATGNVHPERAPMILRGD